MNATAFLAPAERQLRRGGTSSYDDNSVWSESDLKAKVALVTLVTLLLCLFAVLFTISIRQHFCTSRRTANDMDVPQNAGQPREPRVDDESDEQRRERILTRRFERRSWYEYFLKNFIHTLEEDDFVDNDEEEEDVEEVGSKSKSVMVPCSPKGVSRNPAVGSCMICLCDYKVGAKIVRSPLFTCKHVYCQECMMEWLSKGKKKCPICRHWFVPGESIAEQVDAEFNFDFSENATTFLNSSETSEEIGLVDDDVDNVNDEGAPHEPIVALNCAPRLFPGSSPLP